MASAGTQGTWTKTKTGYFTTEARCTITGGQTSSPILSEGLPFASVQMQQLSGTVATSITAQYSNDGVNFSSSSGAGTNALASGGTVLDLWLGSGVPAKWVQFVVAGGDGTSVLQIDIIFMGTRS